MSGIFLSPEAETIVRRGQAAGLNTIEIAALVGRSREWVRQALALLGLTTSRQRAWRKNAERRREGYRESVLPRRPEFAEDSLEPIRALFRAWPLLSRRRRRLIAAEIAQLAESAP